MILDWSVLPQLPDWVNLAGAVLGGGIVGYAIGRQYQSSKLAWSAWGLAVLIFVVGPFFGIRISNPPPHIACLQWFVFAMLLTIGRIASGHPLFWNRRKW